MRKYILLGLLIGIMPNICLGASIRYSQLIKEKQRKIEELEKCTGSTGKLKIAGISTLGLTAAGVAGNVVEAKKIKEYGKESEKLDKKLETARKEKEESATKLADQEKREKESKECMESEGFKNAKLIKSMKKNDAGNCVIESCVKNATENSDGTDCECKDHYKESGKKCVKEAETKKSDTPAETGLKDKEAINGTTYEVDGGEWSVDFSYGTVSGVWTCNSALIGKDYEQQSELSITNVGTYCWCTVDSFIPDSTDEEKQDGENLPWVGLKKIKDSCESSCGEECAKEVKTNSSLRKALYTVK